MQSMRWLALSLGTTFLFFCGCGSNGGSAKAPTALSYSASTAVFTKGVAITPDNPTSSGGAVSSYSVSPVLPAGLTLSGSTGVISGIPTIVATAATYTVTASSSGGSTTATLTITVDDQAPSAFSYAAGTAIYIVNVPITENDPNNTGGTVISYSVSPALPAGLSLSTATGAITGTPTAATSQTEYTVTATNTGGHATAVVYITVNPAASAALAAPAGLAYQFGSATYTVGVAIPANVPTSAGGAPLPYTDSGGNAIPAYSISPALPQGLRIDGVALTFGDLPTGMISGTPTIASPKTTYTVTASNSAGSTTAQLTIEVLATAAAPAGLAYATPAPVYAAGTAIASDNPIVSPLGGVPTNYSVFPDVGQIGLTLDPSSGKLSGTPTAVSLATALPLTTTYTVTASNSGSTVTAPPLTTTYTVTASNSGGTVTAPLTITIYNAHQSVPNMAQAIDPLAAPGSSFQFLDTGMVVSDTFNPQVAPVEWMAGQAVSTAVNPNLNLLAVLTSGYNRVFHEAFPFFDPLYSSEYVFLYDISTGTPVFKQAIPIPNAYHGLAWDPVTGNKALYVSGGMGDAPFGTDPIPYTVNGAPATNNGDNVHIITQQPNGSWALAAELDLGQNVSGQTVVNGHLSGNGLPVPNNQFSSVNSAVFVAPMAAGVAIAPDGKTLVVANYYNDSITVFTGGLSVWLSQWVPDAASPQQNQGTLQGTELDLRPGRAASSPQPGTPGGEYPFWVVLSDNSGPGATAYVSSLRDREIDVVNLGESCAHGTSGPGCVLQAAPSVTARIKVKGQPNKMTLNAAGTLLYVAEDESDTVDVIDLNPRDVGVPSQNQPATVNTVIETIPVIAPPSVMSGSSLAQYTGANTNSVTLSPDEHYLYVTNGNLNNIAVVQLTGTNSGDQVIGLIPTGWYPNSVALSPDGTMAYVVNSKSPTGANPNWCYNYGPSGYPACAPANEYNPQLTKAGLETIPLTAALVQPELNTLTTEVTADDHFGSVESADQAATMAAVRSGIQHVIYILKENRTYDQILGDLGRGNGDPALTLFGQSITPNQHNLALNFVTLDNFLTTAEVSNDGWPWSTSARAPDVVEHQYPVNYAQRGVSLDTEGMNRNVNVAIPTLAQRQASDPLMPGGADADPLTAAGAEDLLPGQADVDAPDGPNDELNTGYLWNDALRAGLTVRDYGFFVDTNCYNEPSCQIPLAHDPFATGTIVSPPTNVALAPFTDQYFRGFDPAFPDYYRFKEWERDFDANYASGGLPNLTLVRFMHDHTGNFGLAIDGVNTPERDVADNDYAVGLLVQKIANSPIYQNNTLIFVVEDDAQDGGDHMDSHRTTAYIAGAYVRDAIVSTPYTTLNFIRTMEEVLGLPPMNLNDALAAPMSDIFSPTPSKWTFTATPAAILYCSQLPLPAPLLPCNDPTPDVKYWTRVTRGMDFDDADLVDGATFNHVLWKGMMGNRPYPSRPSGKDLSQNRDKLLADYRRSLKPKAAHMPKPAGE
jgi:DNA-binding beta-propeller fold protein YncE